MSYILDALHKSEQERQLAAGRSASVLYPGMLQSRRAPIPWLLLAGVAAAAFAIAGLLFWLLRPMPPKAVLPAPTQNASVSATAPQAALSATPALSTREAPVAKAATPPVTPPARESQRPAPAVAKVVPPAQPKQEEALPNVIVTGYIRDGEQGGMAMINDKLVREGEEISPGLRLEKILPEGAVFNFKGRRFTR